MFENKTAWFSDSCLDSAKKLWVDNGGALEDVSLALHIFSDDWEHEDTKVLYDSDAYLKQHLAVFNSQYVIDAAQQGIDQVLLCKYFLIPPCIKNSINLREVQTTTDVRHKDNKSSPASKKVQPTSLPGSRSTSVQTETSSNSSSSPSSLSTTPSKHVSLSENSQQLPHAVRNQVAGKVSVKQRTANEVASTASQNSDSQHGNCSRGIDIDSIPHIQSLPKVISCLRTIYPGKDGVEVKHL